MAKTEFLQIRFSPQDRQRLFNAAAGNHLDPSTWARQLIMLAIEDWEKSKGISPDKSAATSKTKSRR